MQRLMLLRRMVREQHGMMLRGLQQCWLSCCASTCSVDCSELDAQSSSPSSSSCPGVSPSADRRYSTTSNEERDLDMTAQHGSLQERFLLQQRDMKLHDVSRMAVSNGTKTLGLSPSTTSELESQDMEGAAFILSKVALR